MLKRDENTTPTSNGSSNNSIVSRIVNALPSEESIIHKVTTTTGLSESTAKGIVKAGEGAAILGGAGIAVGSATIAAVAGGVAGGIYGMYLGATKFVNKITTLTSTYRAPDSASSSNNATEPPTALQEEITKRFLQMSAIQKHRLENGLNERSESVANFDLNTTERDGQYEFKGALQYTKPIINSSANPDIENLTTTLIGDISHSLEAGD